LVCGYFFNFPSFIKRGGCGDLECNLRFTIDDLRFVKYEEIPLLEKEGIVYHPKLKAKDGGDFTATNLRALRNFGAKRICLWNIFVFKLTICNLQLKRIPLYPPLIKGEKKFFCRRRL